MSFIVEKSLRFNSYCSPFTHIVSIRGLSYSLTGITTFFDNSADIILQYFCKIGKKDSDSQYLLK